MKNLFLILGNFYFLGTIGAQDCKVCDYDAQTNEVMEFQVQVKPDYWIKSTVPGSDCLWLGEIAPWSRLKVLKILG